MIAKELDGFTTTMDALAKAGRAAEEQVAFYLRRAFAKEDKLSVFNGIRLESGGDAAQIDHLILHRWGFIIIESKSVSSRVEVNEHGEWIRWFDGTRYGMPSPILQAQRQAEFMHDYLQEHVKILRGRSLFRQRDFTDVPLDILVVISDTGVIDRPHNSRLDEVCKADQAVDRIRVVLLHYQNMKSVVFGNDELDRIRQFLLDHHRPHVYSTSRTTTPTVRMKQSQPAQTIRMHKVGKPYACRYCQSIALLVLRGRYGYYYKCKQCKGNTHIDTTCPRCGGEEIIRQNGRHYLADCKGCATSIVFYPPLTDSKPSAAQEAI